MHRLDGWQGSVFSCIKLRLVTSTLVLSHMEWPLAAITPWMRNSGIPDNAFVNPKLTFDVGPEESLSLLDGKGIANTDVSATLQTAGLARRDVWQ